MTVPAGLLHDPVFVTVDERAELVDWLAGIHPLWEDRHTAGRALREGQTRRRLLRPVYWLGGWQFACLDYFHPPDHTRDRVVAAEPFPPVLARLVARAEAQVRATYDPADLPDGWRLDTCLVNFYGTAARDGRWVDTARVGGHRDHEPGPVVSLSLGAPARFQFTTRGRGPVNEDVVWEHWLEDRSMLAFGTPYWKELYHRVPNVARGGEAPFDVPVDGFRVRRVNFTLRYVPERFVVPFADLGRTARDAVAHYVETLARHSPYWAAARTHSGSEQVRERPDPADRATRELLE